MLQNAQSLLTELRQALDFAPDAAVAAILLGLAVVVAWIAHAIVFRILLRLAGDRHPYLRQILLTTWRLTRLALMLLALRITLPTVPLVDTTRAALGKAFLVFAIILVGWATVDMVNVVADLYLRRFAGEDDRQARKRVTQVGILKGAAITLLILATVGAALMTFDSVRQFGVSLFASAGVAGLIVGLAARPVLSNMIAGVQIAITQPISLNDVVIVEGEWGRIDEITGTYVVVLTWDLRRLIVPLTYFIEKPFQNWTRGSTNLLGAVVVYTDYTVPVDRVRAKVEEIVKASPRWDGKAVSLQVTDAKADALELRALASAANASDAWDLRCELREKLIAFLQSECPEALPKRRQQTVADIVMERPLRGIGLHRESES
ncbi:MAG: mechanosensitive ion channel family protein [Xanthobacteraceae bacterium]